MPEETPGQGLQSIMIIDDDPINNYICSRLIKGTIAQADLTIHLSARDGLSYLRQLLAHSAEKTPNLIFLDLDMPIMNGWGFLDELEKILPEMSGRPVVCILSSSVYEADIERAREHPQVDRYISKPLTANHLMEISQEFFAPGAVNG